MPPTKPSLLQTPCLDPASTLVLVTGASGLIASNIIKEALDLGYHVRGTARTQQKAANTVREHHNHPNYTATIVSDFADASSAHEIDAAVRGVDSVIHVASDVRFTDDAESIISNTVAGTENFLRAAAREPRVKRFTLTSSSTAALLPPGAEGTVVTRDTWNDEAVDAAGDPQRKGQRVGRNSFAFVVYAASKARGERAMWDFVTRERPRFVANAILPNWNLGRIVGSPGLTAGWAVDLLKTGNRGFFTPQYFVDVVDDARLHLCAAVLDESLRDERIFAFAAPFTANDVVETIKKLRPESKLQVDPADTVRDLSKVPNEAGAKLLEKWYGQDGYKSLEQSVRENLEGV